MEKDSPTAKALLETAISLLRNQVLPNTPAAQKLNLLMIANAMAIAAREFEGSSELIVSAMSDLKRLYPDTVRDDFAELNILFY